MSRPRDTEETKKVFRFPLLTLLGRSNSGKSINTGTAQNVPLPHNNASRATFILVPLLGLTQLVTTRDFADSDESAGSVYSGDEEATNESIVLVVSRHGNDTWRFSESFDLSGNSPNLSSQISPKVDITGAILGTTQHLRTPVKPLLQYVTESPKFKLRASDMITVLSSDYSTLNGSELHRSESQGSIPSWKGGSPGIYTSPLSTRGTSKSKNRSPQYPDTDISEEQKHHVREKNVHTFVVRPPTFSTDHNSLSSGELLDRLDINLSPPVPQDSPRTPMLRLSERVDILPVLIDYEELDHGSCNTSTRWSVYEEEKSEHRISAPELAYAGHRLGTNSPRGVSSPLNPFQRSRSSTGTSGETDFESVKSKFIPPSLEKHSLNATHLPVIPRSPISSPHGSPPPVSPPASPLVSPSVSPPGSPPPRSPLRSSPHRLSGSPEKEPKITASDTPAVFPSDIHLTSSRYNSSHSSRSEVGFDNPDHSGHSDYSPPGSIIIQGIASELVRNTSVPKPVLVTSPLPTIVQDTQTKQFQYQNMMDDSILEISIKQVMPRLDPAMPWAKWCLMMVMGLVAVPVYFMLALGFFDYAGYIDNLRQRLILDEKNTDVQLRYFRKYTKLQKVLSFAFGMLWILAVIVMLIVGLVLGIRRE